MKVVSLFVLSFLVVGQIQASYNNSSDELHSYKDPFEEYDITPRSPLAGMSNEQYGQILNDQVSANKKLMESKIYTLNTFDQEGCNEFKTRHNISENICQKNIDEPLVSIIVTKEIQNLTAFEKKLSLSGFSQVNRQFIDSATDLGAMGLATFGLLYALPESVSKWDKSLGFSDMAAKYGDRVKEGPVWDQDDFLINYVGHPLSGAFYYTMVRHKGLSIAQSAMFSVVMSTFFWEYGIEAFAEVPSIQDLILTPLVGSLLGEVFYQWAESIDTNDGKFLGSEKLGLKYIKQAEFSIVNKQLKSEGHTDPNNWDDFVGIQFRFTH